MTYYVSSGTLNLAQLKLIIIAPTRMDGQAELTEVVD